MRFFSKSECKSWLKGRGLELPSPENTPLVRRYPLPAKPSETFPWAQFMAYQLTHREPVLLWITEWGIWPSSENLHLYYSLRKLHGDSQLLEDAPGHLFLGYEQAELASFLQVAILNGWGGYVLPAMHGISSFFSHDEYVEYFAQEDSHFREIDAWFK